MAKRSRLPDIFLKERYEKDIKYIQVYDFYRPDYNKTQVTPKFYSKYEAGDLGEADPVILNNLKRAKDLLPKEKREWPETTNQIYGWRSEPLVETDRNDPRFYFPRVEVDITKHGLSLALSKDPRKRK